MKAAAVITLTPAQYDGGQSFVSECGLPHLDASEEVLTKSTKIERYLRAQFELNQADPLFVFLLEEGGLSLAQLDAKHFLSIRAGFHGGTARYRRQKGGGKNQMIAKAVGLGSGHLPDVLDATAGLGRDAFVLASLGCRVTMIERVPEIRALLRDAMARAVEWGEGKDSELLEILARMRLVEADAITQMRGLEASETPDVIYLDPMFPPRSQSAQVKKEMRVFQNLVGADPDAAELLSAALGCARKRVVVKRPRLAPTLSADKPSHRLEGKSNRFDIYMIQD